MKRQIKVFTALLLAVVLAFGSQVASAFASCDSKAKFTLNEHDQYTVVLDVNNPSFTSYYVNDSAKEGKVDIEFTNLKTVNEEISESALFQEETYVSTGETSAKFTNQSDTTLKIMVLQ